MTKMVLLVGFLGAGKTTLMKAILDDYKDRKIGVIVNEFGEINIDAKLIGKDGIKMAELSNGSIFCACIKDKFVESLIEMSHLDLEYLFIEASGLADPANMTTITSSIEKNLKTPYEYMGAICIVDGESFTDLYEVLPAITSQLKYSSAVVINKEDLIDDATREEIAVIIKDINPSASQYVTTYCNVDVKKIVDSLRASEEEARESANTVESRLTTFVVKGRRIIPMESLAGFLNEIVCSTYRIKGFVKTDKGNMEVNCVGNAIEILPWGGDITEPAITVISSVGFKLISKITSSIEKYAKESLSL